MRVEWEKRWKENEEKIIREKNNIKYEKIDNYKLNKDNAKERNLCRGSESQQE